MLGSVVLASAAAFLLFTRSRLRPPPRRFGLEESELLAAVAVSDVSAEPVAASLEGALGTSVSGLSAALGADAFLGVLA